MQDVFIGRNQAQIPLNCSIWASMWVKLFGGQAGGFPYRVESCYIALHLGAASEQMSNSVRKYRNHHGRPHNQTFSDMYCVKKDIEMFQEKGWMWLEHSADTRKNGFLLDPDRADHISLEHKLDMPTVPINLFVDSETEVKHPQAVNKLDKRFQLEFTSISTT